MKVLRALMVLIGSVVGGIAAMVLGAAAAGLLNEQFGGPTTGVVEAFGGLLALIGFLTALVILLARLKARRILRALDKERRRIEEQEHGDPFLREGELLLLRLKKHHETIQMQANVGLLSSLTAMFVALVALLSMLYFVGLFVPGEQGREPLLASFSGLCGALSSFIGATFQRMYRSTNTDLRESGRQLGQRNREIAALRLSFQLDEDGRRIRSEWVRRVLGLGEGDEVEVSVARPEALRAVG